MSRAVKGRELPAPPSIVSDDVLERVRGLMIRTANEPRAASVKWARDVFGPRASRTAIAIFQSGSKWAVCEPEHLRVPSLCARLLRRWTPDAGVWVDVNAAIAGTTTDAPRLSPEKED